MPGEAVVRDRLPLRRVGGELPMGGADSGVVVERGHADADRLARVREAAPEGRAAGRAEVLRESVLGLVGAEELLARDDGQRPGGDADVDARRGPGALLAARAVAVARADGLFGDLEANLAAETAALE